MSERDSLRLAARRAALHSSIREGDAGAAARAAARLRVPGARLSAQELVIARDRRTALGRALITARLPRAMPLPAGPAVLRRSQGIPWKRLALALAVISGLVFLVLGPGGAPGGKPEGEASAVLAPDVTRPQVLAQVSRGRTAPTTAPEVIAVVEPSAEPTAAPTAEATAAPTAAPSAGAGGTGGAGGSAGGSGAGGGGIGIGTGPGLITVPTPRPTATPRFPPPGYGRLTIIVLDSRTRQPVPDTCVSFGSLTCTTMTYEPKGTTILSYRTNDQGRWSLDVPLGAPTVSYDMLFFKVGYRVDMEKVTLRRGGSVVKTVFLLKTS